MLSALGICAANGISVQVKSRNCNATGAGLYADVESSAAICEMTVSLCCGNNYVLNSFGEWGSHHLTVSLNFFNSRPNGGFGITVTGRPWFLVVRREHQYVETLYGKINDGSIVFPPTDEKKSVTITTLGLQATGGLGIFKSDRRNDFKGGANMTTSLNLGQTNGRLETD